MLAVMLASINSALSNAEIVHLYVVSIIYFFLEFICLEFLILIKLEPVE